MNTFVVTVRLGLLPLATIDRLNIRTELAIVGVEMFEEGKAAIQLANLLNQPGAFLIPGPQHILKLLSHTRHVI